MDPFSDPQAVARYAEGAPRNVPGYHAMQRMTTLLLAEHVPEEGRVLVLGAGGGLELKVFAEAHPSWAFDGVDPSAEMLKLAQRTLGPLAARATLHQGYIVDAPIGPFDAATCLLTLHFLSLEERRRMLAEVLRRRAFLHSAGRRARGLAVAIRCIRRHRSRPGGRDRCAPDHPLARAGRSDPA
jgi:tRNA (cmo5U34)-methyltransferase